MITNYHKEREAGREGLVRSGVGVAVLQEVLEPGVSGSIWERGEGPAGSRAVSALLGARGLVEVDVTGPEPEVLRDMIAKASGLDRSDASVVALAADVARLVEVFRGLSGECSPRVRLVRLSDDGCALFHADSLPLRLLCTYAGAGVQWVPTQDVRYDELGLHGRTIAEANAAIVPDASRIRTVPAWQVMVLKGREWGGAPPLVHRSPPADGRPRLRLCLDYSDACGC